MAFQESPSRENKLQLFNTRTHQIFPGLVFWSSKEKKRRIFISSLFDIGKAVKESANVSVAELVGLRDGTVLIPTYDWVTFLGLYFKKLPQIKSFYHFRFHKDYPGTVFCKMYWYSGEKAIDFL